MLRERQISLELTAHDDEQVNVRAVKSSILSWNFQGSGISRIKTEKIYVHFSEPFQFNYSQWLFCGYCAELGGCFEPLRENHLMLHRRHKA